MRQKEQTLRNIKTDVVYATYKSYSFGGGWYMNLFSFLGSYGIGCSSNKKRFNIEEIIPNPLKKKDKRNL